MTPQAAYKRLNNLFWMGRLPKVTIVFVDDSTMPAVHGVTLHDGDDLFVEPVIVLNRSSNWGFTLIHEMIHVVEPCLPHGSLFDHLVQYYWNRAKRELPGIYKPRIRRNSDE
jgi:hypothetical protein